MAGTVVELLPSLRFRVELEDRRRVVAHSAAGSKTNFVRLRPGDRVVVTLSPKDPTRGRIERIWTPAGGQETIGGTV